MSRRREPRLQTRVVHGHRRAFVMAGRGPAVLLLHGLGCDHTTWSPTLKRLSRRFTVIAPDLLGHGQSDKPRADYSVGGYANGMRDLLTVLGIDRATVVGHSLGGGVAMQFAYQFPQFTERLMLVAPGGLGRDVHPILRALTLPGAGTALALASSGPVFTVARVLGMRAHAFRLPASADIPGALAALASKRDPASRDAFLHVLRAVLDWRGQVITMNDRAYLASDMPVCILWGEKDTVIPPRHAEAARQAIPGARIELVPGAGHFPHVEFPDRFVQLLIDFVRTTKPSVHDPEAWRELLRRGGRGIPVDPAAAPVPARVRVTEPAAAAAVARGARPGAAASRPQSGEQDPVAMAPRAG